MKDSVQFTSIVALILLLSTPWARGLPPDGGERPAAESAKRVTSGLGSMRTERGREAYQLFQRVTQKDRSQILSVSLSTTNTRTREEWLDVFTLVFDSPFTGTVMFRGDEGRLYHYLDLERIDVSAYEGLAGALEQWHGENYQRIAQTEAGESMNRWWQNVRRAQVSALPPPLRGNGGDELILVTRYGRELERRLAQGVGVVEVEAIEAWHYLAHTITDIAELLWFHPEGHRLRFTRTGEAPLDAVAFIRRYPAHPLTESFGLPWVHRHLSTGHSPAETEQQNRLRERLLTTFDAIHPRPEGRPPLRTLFGRMLERNILERGISRGVGHSLLRSEVSQLPQDEIFDVFDLDFGSATRVSGVHTYEFVSTRVNQTPERPRALSDVFPTERERQAFTQWLRTPRGREVFTNLRGDLQGRQLPQDFPHWPQPDPRLPERVWASFRDRVAPQATQSVSDEEAQLSARQAVEARTDRRGEGNPIRNVESDPRTRRQFAQARDRALLTMERPGAVRSPSPSERRRLWNDMKRATTQALLEDLRQGLQTLFNSPEVTSMGWGAFEVPALVMSDVSGVIEWAGGKTLYRSTHVEATLGWMINLTDDSQKSQGLRSPLIDVLEHWRHYCERLNLQLRELDNAAVPENLEAGWQSMRQRIFAAEQFTRPHSTAFAAPEGDLDAHPERYFGQLYASRERRTRTASQGQGTSARRTAQPIAQPIAQPTVPLPHQINPLAGVAEEQTRFHVRGQADFFQEMDFAEARRAPAVSLDGSPEGRGQRRRHTVDLRTHGLRPRPVVDGIVVMPTPDGRDLTRVVVRAEGRVLEQGRDYVVVRAEDTGAYALRFNVAEGHAAPRAVALEARFAERRSAPVPGAAEAVLAALDRDRLATLAESLERGGITGAAEALRARLRNPRPLPLTELESILRGSSQYVYTSRGTGPREGTTGPFAAFSQYVDDAGRLCYQCTGARSLMLEALGQYFANDSRFSATPRAGYSVDWGLTPFAAHAPWSAGRLRNSSRHAQVELRYDGRVIAVIDATPSPTMLSAMAEGLRRRWLRVIGWIADGITILQQAYLALPLAGPGGAKAPSAKAPVTAETAPLQVQPRTTALERSVLERREFEDRLVAAHDETQRLAELERAQGRLLELRRHRRDLVEAGMRLGPERLRSSRLITEGALLSHLAEDVLLGERTVESAQAEARRTQPGLELEGATVEAFLTSVARRAEALRAELSAVEAAYGQRLRTTRSAAAPPALADMNLRQSLRATLEHLSVMARTPLNAPALVASADALRPRLEAMPQSAGRCTAAARALGYRKVLQSFRPTAGD